MRATLLLYSIFILLWILSILLLISWIDVTLKFSLLACVRCAGKTTTQLGSKPLHSTVLSRTSWFKEVTLWRGMGVAVWAYMGVNLMMKILSPSTQAQAYSPWYSALLHFHVLLYRPCIILDFNFLRPLSRCPSAKDSQLPCYGCRLERLPPLYELPRFVH